MTSLIPTKMAFLNRFGQRGKGQLGTAQRVLFGGHVAIPILIGQHQIGFRPHRHHRLIAPALLIMIIGGLLVTLDDRRILIDGGNALRLAMLFVQLGNPSHQPAIFAESPMPGASSRYSFLSTARIVDVMRAEGWKPTDARQSRPRLKEYSDEDKSGLNIQGGDSLAQMISDVHEDRAEFAVILVHDISRWGRFQDADESAYYEYVCCRAGVSGITARSNSRTTAARCPPSSRA